MSFVVFSPTLREALKTYNVTYEQVRQSIIELGWGDWGGQIMYDYSKAYTEGWGDYTTDDVEKVTGNKSRSIDQFVSEVLAHGFQQQTT